MGSLFLVNQHNASRNPTAVTINTCHTVLPGWCIPEFGRKANFSNSFPVSFLAVYHIDLICRYMHVSL